MIMMEPHTLPGIEPTPRLESQAPVPGVPERPPVAAHRPELPVQSGMLGRPGRLLPSPTKNGCSPDAADGVDQFQTRSEDSRTPRTSFQNSRAYAENTPSAEGDSRLGTPMEFSKGVRGVRHGERTEQPPEGANKQERLPYLAQDGTLVIPFDSPAKYHWWNGGQSVSQTRAELLQKIQATKATPP